MSDNCTTKNVLVKNTAYMYIRMLLMTIISLYTSRIVFQQLGVEDFGIYNMVGSIVLMFNSLKAIFAQASQRFLNYEMGRGNNEKLKLIFNLSVLINILISFVLVIGVEAVGTWFLECQVNVDPSRYYAAKVVFQCSVVATVVSLMTNPFNACIIAHEKMDFYAGLSVLEAIMRLGVCFMLSMFGTDKLILYGLLMLLITIIVYLISSVYCRSMFQECRYSKCWDSDYFKKMTTFAGWSFFGNTSFTLAQSGLNLVLNVFGGPIVNAARGIAYQINNTLQGFVSNIVVVVRPHVTKTYASGQIEKTLMFVNFSSKLYYYIQMLIVVSFTFVSSNIIELWLGRVPEYSTSFINLVLWNSLVRSLCGPIDILFSANGNIKWYQISEGIVLALPLPFSYFALKQGASYGICFEIMLLFEVIHVFVISIIAKYICHFNLKRYSYEVIFPCVIVTIIYGAGFIISNLLISGVLLKVIASIITIAIITIYFYLFGTTKEEKTQIIKLCNSLIKKHGSINR